MSISVVIFRVKRWPSKAEVRDLIKSLHVGREIEGMAWSGWNDGESSHTAAGPLIWEYSSGNLRLVCLSDNRV